MILICIVLFAALSYALSQQRNDGKALSSEKIRLVSAEVIDMGNSLSEATARLRLRRIAEDHISFQNDHVAGYTNPVCTSDECKIFAYDGGGKEWETPSSDTNQSTDWGFTGDLAIQDIGTSQADLVGILPGVSEAVCNQINRMIGLYGNTGTPPVVASITANKFTGSYNATPTPVSGAVFNGQTSACLKVTSASGSAISGGPLSNSYIFYQVLDSR